MGYAAVVGLPSLVNLRNWRSNSCIALICDGSASIPRFVTRKPRNFPVPTPKAHLEAFRRSLWRLSMENISARSKALTQITKQERRDLHLVGTSRTILESMLGASVYKLNTNVMREAAKHFLGKQDFSAFGPLLQLEVEGSGFLYRQVALLLQIGREAIPPDIVPRILATRDRKELAKYALSAPPHGLCLVRVNYNEEHLQLPTACPATSFGRHHSIRKCKLPFFKGNSFVKLKSQGKKSKCKNCV
ncbi:tRNA pseudouridine synthase A [Camellia lanceoleosa]|uniref:tRNA pseudouridine synthase A n=1 Tax=Camellia lanceoleosa TaxID=1840588 RepID=A0ACC0H919_9ERIC|nr:tRNA pseudouridine synthase A [Camellia lanceoleosa]